MLVRGDVWTVVSRTVFHECEALRLTGSGSANNGTTRTILSPFDRPRILQPGSTLKAVRPRRWLHAVRRLAVRATPYGGLASASRASIQLLPFQLEPALAVLRHGRARVLIADEVGLGKTIQAGLILNELSAACDGFRALVVCPAGLREQWGGELRRHFLLESIAADAGWLADAGRDLPRDVNPWVLPGIYISSLDFVKRPEVLRPLEDVTWDALVIDEAHIASTGSARRAAVHAVALRSRRIVLLSATPHSGDGVEFDALCRLGQASDPITIFRRSRHDTLACRKRKTVLFPVRTSDAERRMHRLLASYTGRVARESRERGDSRARLAAIVLRKRALSSAGSLASSVRRRLELLAGPAPEPAGRQLLLPLDEDPLGDEEPEGVLGAPGLADAAGERRALLAIAEAAETAARRESKAAFLLRLLARMREPAIVFTEYRDTLVRLERTLRQAGHEVTLLHGGMGAAERTSAQRAFNDRARLLLATDAASEGLNLHHRCRSVIHYELPWSPVRLEQRTGRVDRYGQLRAVHEMFLVAGHTAERLVLAPLARRTAAASATLGGATRLLECLTESRVASAVLDGEPLEDTPVERTDTPTGSGAAEPVDGLHIEAAHEVARLEIKRMWECVSPRRSSAPDRPVIACLQRRSAAFSGGITCIYTLFLHTADGQIADSTLICVNDSGFPAACLRRTGDVVGAARRHLSDNDAVIQRVLQPIVSDRLERVGDLRNDALAAQQRRERHAAGQLPSEARRMVQASLFDRRAVRAREASREVGRALLEDAGLRLQAIERSRQLRPVLELSAVLIAPHDVRR